MEKNNQWDLSGDCKNCRRAEYCKKACSARKKRNDQDLRAYINAIYDSVLPEPIRSHAKNAY